MNRRAGFAFAGGAMLLLGAGIFLVIKNERTASDSAFSASDTFAASAQSTPGAENPREAPMPVRGSRAAASVSSTTPEERERGGQGSSREERLEELALDIADRAYSTVGEPLVDYLVASGMSRTDGERVIRQSLREASHCAIDALRAQADAQRVSFDDVLGAVAADIYQSDGPLLAAVIDINSVRAREAPCLLNVLQEAGVPLSAMEQLGR